MKPSTERLNELRAQALAMVRQMDWLRGLRAGTALCAPLVLGDLAGLPNLGWAALGGFEAILSDTGGPYRTRMSSLVTLSLGGAAGLVLGSVVGGNLLWALPVTVLWCFIWSYLAVLGQPFSSAGVLVEVIFICGIGAPTSSWHEAVSRGLLLLAGGAWAALLSLFLWPLDAYRPARAAVSTCYEELASFLGSVAELAARPEQRPALWHRLAQHHQYRVRRAVEQGWQAVASIRAEHRAETAQGNQLVVLLENADLLIARTVALAEYFEGRAGGAQGAKEAQSSGRIGEKHTSGAEARADSAGLIPGINPWPTARASFSEGSSGGTSCFDRSLSGLADLRSVELWVAALLVKRRGQSVAHARAKSREMERLPQYVESCMDKADLNSRFLLVQIAGAASLVGTAVESAALMRLGQMPGVAFSRNPTSSVGQFGYVYERLGQLRQGWDLDQLAANFTGKSLVLRHAARVSLVCGVDVALITLLHIDHGYWLLMTSLIVLQPHVSGTLRRGLERVGGTVGGGILAALLAATLHSQMATAAVLFPLALLALAFLPVSYAAFAFFLTPAFVLAWLPYSGDWQLAMVRVGNTVAGAAISLLAMVFLFPAYERDRAPDFLRASIRADRRYLLQMAEGWRSVSPGGVRGRSGSGRLLANARRAAGLAHNDTEESLERLLAESWPRRRPFAQFVAAFVTYLRRFAQSVTALATLEGDWEWKQSKAVEDRLELLDRRLQWLENGTTGDGSEALAWPEAGTRSMESAIPAGFTSEDHPGERQLERLERQAEVLHRQLKRLREHGWLPGAEKP